MILVSFIIENHAMMGEGGFQPVTNENYKPVFGFDTGRDWF
jgi:hypothetical protein